MALSPTLVFKVIRGEPKMVCALGTKPTPHEIKLLSDIDDQEGLRFLVPAIFFYGPPKGGPNKSNPAKCIKEGLARALEHYYPLGGRIFEGENRKLMIECNNEGVLFVEASVDINLEQLGDNIFPPCPYLDHLLPPVGVVNIIIGSPLFSFQVTRFSCGGFSVGILLNHAIVDAYGIKMFVDGIGELIKGASSPSVPPVWQREILSARSPPTITCTHNEYQHHYPPKPLKYATDTFIRTSVFFSRKQVDSLRSQLPSERRSTTSRFDLITACLWKCRTIALEADCDDMVRVSIITNGRRCKEIDIPMGYYGNAFVYPAAVSKAGALCVGPLVYVVDLIKGAKAQLSREYMKSAADLMVIKGRPLYVEKWNFIVSDLTRVGMDEIDLGWGKPVYGGISWASPVISFYSNAKNGKGEDGVAVALCLPALVMERFQHELNNVICSST